MFLIGIDVGGTFTDLTLFDTESRRTWTGKTPSTPADQSIGVIRGTLELLERAGVAPSQIGRILHGTTVATNTILEGKGARSALLTTAGFRHVLDIARADGPRDVNIYVWIKPERPVTADLIFEIAERIGPDGEVLTPLDEAGVRTAVTQARDRGVQSIAISFLHAYLNPEHERAAGRVCAAVAPDLPVSLSSDILPAFREYERTLATALNATIRPVVQRYLGTIDRRLREAGIPAPCLVMQSNGGVAGAETVAEVPVYTVLSGPAAGVVAATRIGAAAGYDRIVSLDMGGTSTDVALTIGGRIDLTTQARIGPFPLPTPVVDLVTIGAGGGSLARVEASGAFRVGPRSAGAVPGPACYGRGGTEPTVTDANLVLGRLPAEFVAGGLRLDVDLARAAIANRVADPLGISVTTAAHGIVEVVNHQMAGAIRNVSVERGHDPADFALVPFGGAGALHGAALADLLGIPTVLVPPNPGVLSTFGLLATDLQSDFVRTCLQRGPDYDLSRLNAVLAALRARATEWLDRERVPAADREVRRGADVRYPAQGFELTVEIPGEASLTEADLRALEITFHEKHRQLYSHAFPGTPIELVNLRVTANGRIQSIEPRPWPHTGGTLNAARTGDRPVSFAGEDYIPTPIYDWDELSVGQILPGPAIVEGSDATVLVPPGSRTEVDRLGCLVGRQA